METLDLSSTKDLKSYPGDYMSGSSERCKSSFNAETKRENKLKENSTDSGFHPEHCRSVTLNAAEPEI